MGPVVPIQSILLNSPQLGGEHPKWGDRAYWLNVVAQAGWKMHLQKVTWDLRSVTPYRLSGTEGVMDKDTVQRDIQVQEGTAMLTRFPP